MKKQYIQPETMSQKMNFITRICVDSVRGNLNLGGQDNNIDPL